MAASALCNMSEQCTVRLALSEAGAIPVLINLLSSPVHDILSRATIILADITRIGSNQVSVHLFSFFLTGLPGMS